MMKSDTDFICRVLCKTSQSINPATYLLFWHSVAVSCLRSQLILSCLYALWTFFLSTMQKCILCLLRAILQRSVQCDIILKHFELWLICKNYKFHWDQWLYHVLCCVSVYGLSKEAKN
jgi:hypothetical protein